jgi:tetratricopeptide (TPR) repeat protein
MTTNAELAEAQNNLGNAYVDQGQVAQGIERYREALRLDPTFAEAHNNLGIALFAQGEHAAAVECFRQALRFNPNYANAHNNLGNALKHLGKSAEAADCYREAIRINPQHAPAHNNLGLALLALGQAAEATDSFRQAVALSPHYANAYNNLGTALKTQGQAAEAEPCYWRALQIDPNHVDALHNLGQVLADRKDLARATEVFRRALELSPDHADLHNSLGNVLHDQGEDAEAEVHYRRALALDPQHGNAHGNLGNLLLWQGHIAEATECYRRALDINPQNQVPRFNRSILLLMQGDFEAGWKDYELRWVQPKAKPRAFQEPRWDGSPLAGQTILLYAEQGLGDSIQFIRYALLVRQLGGRVVFECQPALFPLLQGIAGVDHLVAAGSPLPPFDVQAPLLSVPGLLGTTLSTIPADVPYLHAQAERVAFWRNELAPVEGFKVGIAWQGNSKHPGDRYRSFPLVHFEKLALVQGVRLISLQKGPAAAELPSAESAFTVLELGERLDADGAFLDTAAVMVNLDLVVTADTAVAHLAGALGVRVWTVLALVPDWRWLLERADSPWYPTMRLFRQRHFGAWDEVFTRVADDLYLEVCSR